MRIKTTIWLGMLVVTVGYVTTVVAHDLASRRNEAFLNHLDQAMVPAVHAAQEAVLSFNQMMTNFESGVVSGDSQALVRAHEDARRVDAALQDIGILDGLPLPHPATVVSIRTTLTDYISQAGPAYRRLATESAEPVPEDTLRQLTSAAANLRNGLGALEMTLQGELHGTIAEQRRRMATQRLVSELTMFALLFTAIAGIALLTMRWSNRLQLLIGASRQLAYGDYDTPIEIAGPDEVGRLGEHTERMRRAISERDLSLRVFNDTLEQQIADRTREIEQRNRELSTQIAERQRAEGNLRAAHLEAESMLASLGSALIGLDEEDRITRWNLAAAELFGRPATDVIGLPLGESGIRCDWMEVYLAIERCVASGRLVEVQALRYDGPLGDGRWLSLLLSPSRSQDSSHSGRRRIVLLATDITQRRLEESQAGQHAKLESIGQLAAGIAHEINTPIQFIGDNLRFLADLQEAQHALRQALRSALKQEPAPTAAEVDHLLAEMEQRYDIAYLDHEMPKAIAQSMDGIRRVTEIIQAMKTFSHPDHGGTTQLDLNAAVRTTIEVSRNEYKYVADIQTDLDAALPSVHCHAGGIHQVLLNLVVNAAHAIAGVVQNTTSKGTIRIATIHDGDSVVIRISDTGTGIPLAIQPRIFTPFFTTKGVGKGTGQGLHLAYTIITKQHGGSITFTSIEGCGTTFEVRLPIR